MMKAIAQSFLILCACQFLVGDLALAFDCKHALSLLTSPAIELHHFLTVMRQVSDNSATDFESRHVSTSPGTRTDRALGIVANLFDPNSPLRLELKNNFQMNGSLPASQLWNLYFAAYDKLVAFSDGYMDIFRVADRALPFVGTIGDLGSGTSNGGSILASLSSGRTIRAMDISQVGNSLAAKKLSLLSGRRNLEFSVEEQDVTKGIGLNSELDGALMNNVLYTLPPSQKLEVLRSTFRALKPGAIFVLNDPNEYTQLSKANVKKFLSSIVSSAIQNGSKASEFDVALFSLINIDSLIGGNVQFLPKDELTALVQEAGFEIKEQPRTVYYQATTLLVLRKPSI